MKSGTHIGGICGPGKGEVAPVFQNSFSFFLMWHSLAHSLETSNDFFSPTVAKMPFQEVKQN